MRNYRHQFSVSLHVPSHGRKDGGLGAKREATFEAFKAEFVVKG